MQVEFEVPEEIVRKFDSEPGGISRVALEAFVAESVRLGRLTVFQARQLLGLSRYDMDGFLKARGVYLPATHEDVIADGGIASGFAK